MSKEQATTNGEQATTSGGQAITSKEQATTERTTTGKNLTTITKEHGESNATSNEQSMIGEKKIITREIGIQVEEQIACEKASEVGNIARA